MKLLEKHFHITEKGTTVTTEIFAGASTFFAMVYILFVNPVILGAAGMPETAVFWATLIATASATLLMGVFANVPYAQAPGMGLNSFFSFTIVIAMGFTWKQALSIVFLSGVLNTIVSLTKIRKMLVFSIPKNIQNAIGAGIGLFICYVGIKNANLLEYVSSTATAEIFEDGTIVADSSILPKLVLFDDPYVQLAILGIAITIALVVLKIPGGILIGIAGTTLLGIPMGVVHLANFEFQNLMESFSEIGAVFGVIFTEEGIPSLFSDVTRIPTLLTMILALSLSDTFDSLATFIGAGRRTGILSTEFELTVRKSGRLHSRMDRAFIIDALTTPLGAFFGVSNTTTYVESVVGIEAGGRTGFSSVITALLFILSGFSIQFIQLIPNVSTAPALIVVGCTMCFALKDIEWNDYEESLPAFFTMVTMMLTYSISDGIALGFISHIFIKICKGKFSEVHPTLFFVSLLFIINYAVMAL